eukprot:192847_1
MWFFCSIIFLWKIAVANQAKSSPTYATLSYPLTSMDERTVTQWGIDDANMWVDFMNGDINWGEYKKRGKNGGTGWSPQMVNVVDGVTYSNWGQFQSYCMHLRNLFKKGSISIIENPTTTTVTTTVIDGSTLRVQFDINLELDVTIGSYVAFQSIDKSMVRTHYFDPDMVLIRSELTSESMGAALFNHILHATAQFIQPLQDSFDGVSSHNPFFLSMALICVLGSAMIGFLTFYCLAYCCKVSRFSGESKGEDQIIM